MYTNKRILDVPTTADEALFNSTNPFGDRTLVSMSPIYIDEPQFIYEVRIFRNSYQRDSKFFLDEMQAIEYMRVFDKGHRINGWSTQFEKREVER